MAVNKSHGLITIGARLLKKNRVGIKRWNSCHFSSQSGGKTTGKEKTFLQPPLTDSLPGLPKPVYSNLKEENQTTYVTTLPNGLRVASENRFGQFCTVGVVIDSGSRYEVAYPSGVSHFLEKLAFSSTSKFENRDKIMRELEQYGGICDCQSTRDAFIYAASADIRGLDPVMNVLADVVLRPQLTPNEVQDAQQTIKFELENLRMKPEQELVLMDMIHAAAYRDNTLGLPKVCPEKNISSIDRSILFTYMKNYYSPERIVVAGVGVEHEAFLETVNKYFVDEKSVWDLDSSLILPDKHLQPDRSIAQYTGGIVQEECEIPQFLGPSGLPELAHVVIGLEGTSHQDEDFIPLCVLNMMMGGGGSFSAGGPGKGMYTRLYTNVLHRHHWMFSATAYNHAYADSGIFCIHGSSEPPHVGDIVEVLVKELVAMAGPVDKIELQRAKKQLQSMLLMNLEARPVVFEDMARQVLATGHRKRPEVFIKAIEQVTADDVLRVAHRLLASRPAVAARGDIKHMPSFNDIQAGLMDSRGMMPGRRSRLSLFR